ncbi:MAG: hypothetical protein RBT15_05330 [Gudongella sp.]|jgi:hypothetical protein|nr:hypothetical protein [Gudongella sp.]
MIERDSGLPMHIDSNKDLFDKLVALCNCTEYRCSKYKAFIKAYLDVYQLNVTLAEMGLEQDMSDLAGYEDILEYDKT